MKESARREGGVSVSRSDADADGRGRGSLRIRWPENDGETGKERWRERERERKDMRSGKHHGDGNVEVRVMKADGKAREGVQVQGRHKEGKKYEKDCGCGGG